jgi:hypothetical protein
MSQHDAEAARSRLRVGRSAVIAAITVCAVVVGVIAIGATGGGGSAASTDSPSTSTATVEIKRQDLVESDSEDGTLGYSDSRDVINHLSGYVTWLPHEGSVIRPDHTLYKVDGSPVILMSGSLPAYRRLDSSVSGPDVEQLERDLRALGYDSGHDITVDGTWTSATTAAVKRWQDAHGLSQTGSIELGRVVFQPGSRRISSVNATLGGSSSGTTAGAGASAGTTGRTGASASTAAGTSSTMRTASPAGSPTASQAAVLRTSNGRAAASTAPGQGPTTTTPAPTTTAPAPTTTTPAPTPTTPAPTTRPAPSTGQGGSKTQKGTTEKRQTGPSTSGSSPTATRAAGSSSGASGSSSGAPAGSSSATTPANAIMTTTSTRKVVTVNLDTTKSELARRGATVAVELPSNKTVRGRITSIGKVATSSSSSSTNGASSSSPSSASKTATIKLTIRLFAEGAALDQAPVTVRFEQSRVRDALAIPVTALLAQPGGKFAVEVVEGSNRRPVSVTPGTYTSGYVQITGAGLQAGMRVTNAAVQ